MESIDELIRQLGSQDEVLRMRAGERLLRLGGEAVQPLMQALNDPEHPARHWVASTLGYLGDRRAVEPLMEALKDKEPLVRLHAASALGRLRDERAVPALIHALFDSGRVGFDPATAEPITVRAAAAQSLGDLRDRQAVPALLSCLKDQNRSMRRSVIQALAKLGDEAAIEPLIDLLSSEESENLREVLVRALGKLCRTESPLTERVMQTLRSLARDDPNEKVRAAASDAVEELNRRPPSPPPFPPSRQETPAKSSPPPSARPESELSFGEKLLAWTIVAILILLPILGSVALVWLLLRRQFLLAFAVTLLGKWLWIATFRIAERWKKPEQKESQPEEPLSPDSAPQPLAQKQDDA